MKAFSTHRPPGYKQDYRPSTDPASKENAGPTEFLRGSQDQGKRVRELGGVFVESPVVGAASLRPSYPRRRSLMPLVRWMDERTVVGDHP